jgi:hypothetical protein
MFPGIGRTLDGTVVTRPLFQEESYRVFPEVLLQPTANRFVGIGRRLDGTVVHEPEIERTPNDFV